MPTLDYATRPAKKPPRDRPVSAVSVAVYGGLLMLLCTPFISSVGTDPLMLIALIGGGGALLARLIGRRLQRAGRVGWLPMVGVPLLASLTLLVVVLTAYNLILPRRAFHAIFHLAPSAGADLEYSPRRNFSAGGHRLYFHADAATVARLVQGAGLRPDDDEIQTRLARGEPPTNACVMFFAMRGYGFIDPVPAGIDPHGYSNGGYNGTIALLHDAGTGEVWVVKKGR